MKLLIYKLSVLVSLFLFTSQPAAEDFQGQAFYYSKSKMELGKWGARLSEVQKKQVQERLKNRLEKSFVLDFNKEASVFTEEDKLDAVSGATDSWGSYFSRGKQYKNVKDNSLVQSQEFYGKRFLVKDKLMDISWKLSGETKQIGNYTCFKATASIPTNDLTWYEFSWGKLKAPATDDQAEPEAPQLTEVEAWYTTQIPVSHGPGEYWGLPGLILEVSAGNTVMLCSKIVMNPDEIMEIEAPIKGKEVSINEYEAIVAKKMQEMRSNRMGRSRP